MPQQEARHGIKNCFLQAFSPDELDCLGPLDFVKLHRNRYVYRTGQPIDHIIFVESGLGSTLQVMPGRQTVVEIWTYGGAYGMIGSHTLFGRRESLYDYITRIDSCGWRVSRDAIDRAVANDPDLAVRIGILARITNMGISQVTACRGIHSIEQRLCRLLLVIREAIDSDLITLSATALARMVPMSRGFLYDLANSSLFGVIVLSRGVVCIRDAAALERRACPCLRHVAAERERMFKELLKIDVRKNALSVRYPTYL